ncbi:MAG: lysine biosynthesis protein LysW [Thermoleophilia bacterium]|nr:lysine biosynthesis protein LysW [Thermoleophilia bacterium]
MTLIATCPVCDEDIELDDDIELSEVVVCQSCEREVEVVSLDPLTLVEWEEEEK